MKNLCKKFLLILCGISVLLALVCSASAATVTTEGGPYGPFWGEEWVTEETDGLWKGFYIDKSDNTLRTDLVNYTAGEWRAPSSKYATVWEGTQNIVAPSDECDVGYLLNCVEGGQIRIVVKGHMEVPGCTEVTFAIYRNNFSTMVYPENGSAQVLAEGAGVDIDMVVTVNKGDKIFFRWHSPVESANSPQFRFEDISVKWLTIEDNPAGAGDEEPTKPGDDIIIDDNDSYYLTSKFQDVTVDEKNNVVTLNKKLTLKEFKESFDIKINHTIKVIDTVTTKEVTDDNAIITGDMICRVFNQGTPLTNISIRVNYDTNDTNEPAVQEDMPVWAIVLIVVCVVLVAVVVVLIVIIKKKGRS